MMHDLVKNLEDLTQIKYSILNKLVTISENCICDYMLHTLDNDEDILIVNIGIGFLYINIVNNELEYKFIPNKKLEKRLLKTIETEESPLVQAVEAKLNKKILDTYKELL